MTRRAVSADGLAFIKAHEGFRARAAALPDGRWLIGYSHVEDDAEGREIAPEEAEERLRQDLTVIEEAVDNLVFAPLGQRQIDALVSFGFSIGVPAFRACGIAEALNEGRLIDAAEVFDRWRYGRIGDAVRPVDALVRRRAAEKAMFLALEAGPVPAPSALLRPASSSGREAAAAPPPAPHRPALVERLGRIWAPPPRARGEPEPDDAGPCGASERAGAPTALSGTVAARPAGRLREPVEPGGRWAWLTGGGGLALSAVALGNLRAAATAGAGGEGDAAWVLAMVAGVLALGAGGYYAARRLAGFPD